MRALWTVFRESFILALQELNNARLRAFLSLTGITIGIVCIISVFAAVDSLERNIRQSVNQIGDNVVFVEKWPWAFSNDYPWWKYVNRPNPNYDDYKALQRHLEKAAGVAIQVIQQNKVVEFKSNYYEGVSVAGISHEWSDIFKPAFTGGRYFSNKESASGDNVAVIGYKIAVTLFGDPARAIDRQVKVLNRKVQVIGVLEKEGESIVGNGLDNTVLVPYSFMQKFINERSRVVGQRINVSARKGISLDALKAEITKVLRNNRKLAPGEEDNFALNQMSILSQGITQTFSVINIAGLVIGGFSILVGGFGIANIMFVSVKERTKIIGIKMSLGAKRIFILMEFLIESIMLCLIGGGIGLLIVYGLFVIANQLIDFTLILSFKNILLGLLISFVIGVISGVFPATSASKMDPVEAMQK